MYLLSLFKLLRSHIGNAIGLMQCYKCIPAWNFSFTLITQVHKSVMVACSDYFRAMLTGPGRMKESREDNVELRGVSAQGLKAVVDFAYTGKINLCLQNLEEVILKYVSGNLFVPH